MPSNQGLETQSNKIDNRLRTLWSRKRFLYQELYEFTFKSCGFCVESGCACKDRICQHVGEQAQKYGHALQATGHRIRFIGPNGCIVPPYLRETCTLYICEKAKTSQGFASDKYQRLKRLCEKVDWLMMEIEEKSKLLKRL